MPDWGSGLTNLVGRATAGAAELNRAELIEGLAVLEPGGLNAHHQPEHLAAAFRALRQATVSGSGGSAL